MLVLLVFRAASGPRADCEKNVKRRPFLDFQDTSFSVVAVLSWARFLLARTSFYVFGRRGNEYGSLGEAWCALTGDRIWAMHLPFSGLSYGLNKDALTQRPARSSKIRAG